MPTQIELARETYLGELQSLGEDLGEKVALDETRETLEQISRRAFDREYSLDGAAVMSACIDAFDAKREEIRVHHETLNLLGRFYLLHEGSIHSEVGDKIATGLLSTWDEPWRKFHTRRHLFWCLEELDRYKKKCRDWQCVGLAFWCANLSYHPHNPAAINAQWSAAECRHVGDYLQWNPDRSAAAARMVLNTARQFYAVGSFDEALMVDIELGHLSARPDGFDAFEEQLRLEYEATGTESMLAGAPKLVPWGQWRAAQLRELGGESFSYRSAPYLERNEHARENIARALARLEAT